VAAAASYARTHLAGLATLRDAGIARVTRRT
jgi:hypothetical protein